MNLELNRKKLEMKLASPMKLLLKSNKYILNKIKLIYNIRVILQCEVVCKEVIERTKIKD